MLRPHSNKIVSTLISATLCCALTLIFDAGVRAGVQQTPASAAAVDDTALGIKLYKQGDAIGAIEALRRSVKLHKEDANAWLYLGLALNRVGQIKDARKAFEKAVKLLPNSPEAHTGWAYTLLLSDKTRRTLSRITLSAWCVCGRTSQPAP
jgi:Flp pilus assembly protein TadD